MPRLGRNIAYNLAGQLVVLFLTLLAARFVFRGLGGEAFGIILFVQTVNLLLVTTFELGVASTVIREVAAHNEQDVGYVHNLLRSYALVYWCGYLLFAALLFVIAPRVASSWLNLRVVDPATATTLFRLLSLSSLLAIPRALYAGIFRGLQQLGLKNVLDVGTASIQQGGVVAILILSGSVFAVAGWIAFTYVVGLLAYLIAAARLVSWRALVPGHVPGVIARTLPFSLRMVSISGLAAVHAQSDKIIVSKLLSVTAFGYYGFASAIAGRAALVTNAIGEAAFPSLAGLVRQGNGARARAQYRGLQDLVTFGTVPVFAGLAFAAFPIFTFLFGTGIAATLILPTALLSLGWFMNGSLTIPYLYSLAADRPEVAVGQNFWALVLVLPFTAILTLRFGLAGAAASWVVYHVFAYLYSIPRLCPVIGIHWTAWFGQLGKVAALAMITYGPAWAIAWLTNFATPALAIGFVIASLAFAVVGYRLIGAVLRSALRDHAKAMTGSVLHAA